MMKIRLAQIQDIVRKYRNVVLLILLLVPSILYTYKVRLGSGKPAQWQHAINSDGAGYYEYLRAAFLYHDFSYRYALENKEETNSKNVRIYINKYKNKYVNKYYAGNAVLMSPFFAGGYLVAKLSGQPLDGYSKPFQYAISLSAIVYMLLGAFFLLKLLLLLNIRYFCSALVVLVYIYGSNLFFYYTMTPAYSHIYSFTLIAAFLYYLKIYLDTYKSSLLIVLSVLLAFIILVRPTNGLVVFMVFFLSGSFSGFVTAVKQVLQLNKHLFIGVFLFIAIISIQFVFYYLQTGEWIVWSYQDEGFNFLHPELINVFFSYQKGILFYVPIVVLSIVALPVLITKGRYYAFGTLLLVIAIISYVLSSWHCWHNAGSLGIRLFTDYYPVFAIPLAFLFHKIGNSTRRLALLTVFVLLIIAFNQLKVFQYNKYIIHHGLKMNKANYWEVFFKTSKRYQGIYYRKQLDEKSIVDSVSFSCDFETKCDDFEIRNIEENKGATSDKSVIVDKNYSGVYFEKSMHELAAGNKNKLFLKVEFDVLFSEKNPECKLFTTVSKPGKSYSWDSQFLKDYTKNNKKWQHFEYTRELPLVKSPEGLLKVYFFNNGEAFYLDNFSVIVYRIK